MKNPTRRLAFTLIELLVVIAIIGVLIGLLIPAVMSVRARAADTRAKFELTQLDAGAKRFYSKFGFYPPSSMQLCEQSSSYTAATASSKAILLRMFPSLGRNAGGTWNVDWNGNGSIDAGVVPLKGNQCLVFFLGGINLKGFSDNPLNPADPAGTWSGPFFEFQGGRVGSTGYTDAYGKNVYAYFSPTLTGNYVNTDCDGLLGTPSPYRSSASVFLNKESCQIICAGRDGQFGPGSSGGLFWTKTSAATLPLNARDDFANFAELVLSAGQ